MGRKQLIGNQLKEVFVNVEETAHFDVSKNRIAGLMLNGVWRIRVPFRALPVDIARAVSRLRGCMKPPYNFMGYVGSGCRGRSIRQEVRLETVGSLHSDVIGRVTHAIFNARYFDLSLSGDILIGIKKKI